MRSRLGLTPAASAVSPCRPAGLRGGGCAEGGALVRPSQQPLPAVRTAVSAKKLSRSSGAGVTSADTPLGCWGRAAEKTCPPAPAPRGSRTQGGGWLPPGPPPCPSVTAPCVPASTTPSPSRLALRGVLWPVGCSALGAGVDTGAWREVPGQWPLSVAQRRSRGPGARLCC